MGLLAYLRELKDKPDISEVGLYTPFATHIVEDILGYPPQDYHIVKSPDRTTPDLRLFGQDHAEWVVGEIKLNYQQIRDPKRRRSLWSRQVKAKHYIRPETVYVILAARHTIYVCDVHGKVLAGAHFDSDHVYDAVAHSKHPRTDRSLRTILHLVTYEEAYSRARYARFRAGALKSGYLRLDDASLPMFEQTFQYATEILLAYARRAWERLKAEAKEFFEKQADLDQRIADWRDDPKTREILEGRRGRLRIKHRLVALLFEEDYPEFKRRQAYAGTHDEATFEEIFLTDTVYVVLSRLLFVRLCEDLGFVKRKVSNGGLAVWRDFTTNIQDRYLDLLEVAFRDAESVYTRLFERTVFDWYTSTDGELDALLERILYRLNAFTFDRVDRDLLGQLYQRFLPAQKRKRLGEFYTDDEIVDYILARVGLPEDALLSSRRLLDPACGSYTFGVRAIPHLLAHASSLSPPDQIDLIRRVLIAFDINPFAAFIAQMSLLFTVLPLYKQAKVHDPSYRLPSFSVFAVNSLLQGDAPAEAGADLPETPETALPAATEYYDYAVGNPPYVRNERIPEQDRAAVEATFSDIRHGNTDLAAYFIHRAVADWLKADSGMLGMVVSLGLANSASASKLREFLRKHEIVELVSLEWMATELFQGTDIIPMLLFARRTRGQDAESTTATSPIRIVTGLRSKQDLRRAASSRRFYQAHARDIPRSDWETLSPFGDWCLEVIPDDVPVVQKLRALPTLASAGVAKAHYGVKVGPQPKGSRLVISADEPIPSEGRYLPFHKGDDACAFGLSPADDLIDTRGFTREARDADPSLPCPADPSIWAWWRPGGPNHVAEGPQNAFEFHNPHAPSDNRVAVVPGIYVALLAGLLDPSAAVSSDSTRVVVPYATSAVALAAFLNSAIARYYAFLTMRAGILLRRRSTIYPRTIEHLPCPPLESGIFEALHSLGSRACELAELIDTDELDVFLREMAHEADLMPGKLLPGMDFSGWSRGELPPEAFAALPERGHEIRLSADALIKGDPDTLLLLLCAARSLEGPVAPAQAANLQLPREQSTRGRIAAAIRSQAAGLPGYRAEFDNVEQQINEAVMEALGLSSAERKYLMARCQEFPLCDTVSRPRYLWSADRKQQARRRYDDGARYR